MRKILPYFSILQMIIILGLGIYAYSLSDQLSMEQEKVVSIQNNLDRLNNNNMEIAEAAKRAQMEADLQARLAEDLQEKLNECQGK